MVVARQPFVIAAHVIMTIPRPVVGVRVIVDTTGRMVLGGVGELSHLIARIITDQTDHGDADLSTHDKRLNQIRSTPIQAPTHNFHHHPLQGFPSRCI